MMTQNFRELANLMKYDENRVYKPLDLGNERRYYFKRQEKK